jgi:hypothetical protein
MVCPLYDMSQAQLLWQNMLGVAHFLCDKTAILGDTHSKEYNVLEPGSVSKTLKLNHSSKF